jgi:hypothetical protein
MAERLIPLALGILLISLFAIGGCEDGQAARDQRLNAANQSALQAQRQQNELVAAQSKALADNSQQITAAAQAVLSHEHQIREQLGQQQARIDTGRSELEQERQAIARQRARDPIIAAALQQTGTALLCLLPLLLAFLALRQMQSQEPDYAAVAELLVTELTTAKPRFLPAPVLPRGPENLGYLAPPRGEEPPPNSSDESAPPF